MSANTPVGDTDRLTIIEAIVSTRFLRLHQIGNFRDWKVRFDNAETYSELAGLLKHLNRVPYGNDLKHLALTDNLGHNVMGDELVDRATFLMPFALAYVSCRYTEFFQTELLHRAFDAFVYILTQTVYEKKPLEVISYIKKHRPDFLETFTSAMIDMGPRVRKIGKTAANDFEWKRFVTFAVSLGKMMFLNGEERSLLFLRGLHDTDYKCEVFLQEVVTYASKEEKRAIRQMVRRQPGSLFRGLIMTVTSPRY